jgi:nucleoside-diphosphate-sugar epimerase
MEGLSISGGTGFVGSRYHSKHGGHKIERNNYVPKSNDILYFISTTHNYNVFTDVHVDINTNLNVLVDTLEECRKKQITGVFNFISSCFVYGSNSHYPVLEYSYCNPKGFYSITKRAAEQLLISYCSTFGLKYRILRLSNVVGKEDSKVSSKKNILQYMINRIKRNEPIEIHGNGDFYRDYIHVDDCVDAINLVVNNHGYYNSIYNISNGDGILFKEVIRMAYEKLNSKSVITYVSKNTESIILNNDKIKDLGYKQKYQIEDIVDDLIN